MRIADLFCGAGGAAWGIHLACEEAGVAHEIVGFDIKPMPRYPFKFVQQDALTVNLGGFDAVWASPPCQFYTRLRGLPWMRGREYWRSIPPTRGHLLRFGKPYILENVSDAGWDMPESIVLCGQNLGLNLYRHRRFESTHLLLQPVHQKHRAVITPGRASLGKRHHGLNGWNGAAPLPSGVQRHRSNLGIPWMIGTELAQAIPPVFAKYVWAQLLQACATRGTGEEAGTKPKMEEP